MLQAPCKLLIVLQEKIW